jgi:hypothetical protein
MIYVLLVCSALDRMKGTRCGVQGARFDNPIVYRVTRNTQTSYETSAGRNG